MTVNTNALVAMTDANQNFSKVVRIVDDEGMAVILKNNKPKYIVVGFDEYESIHSAIEARKKKLTDAAESIMDKYDDAFRELAK